MCRLCAQIRLIFSTLALLAMVHFAPSLLACEVPCAEGFYGSQCVSCGCEEFESCVAETGQCYLPTQNVVYVDGTNGDDAAPGAGTQQTPVQTLQAAFAVAGVEKVYVTKGAYTIPEGVDIPAGIEIVGGFSSGFTSHDDSDSSCIDPAACTVISGLPEDLSNIYPGDISAGPTSLTVTNQGLTISTVRSKSVVVAFSLADVNTTPEGAIEYLSYVSTTDALDSLTEVLAAQAVGNQRINEGMLHVHGLLPSTTYYLNVVATDAWGNKAVYTKTSFTTLASGDSSIVSIGGYQTGAALITGSGHRYAWGYDGNATDGTPVGDGVPGAPSYYPNHINDGLDWISLSKGPGALQCGIVSNGDAYCMGQNASGEAGSGTTVSANSPTLVVGGHKWHFITVGSSSSCGIATTGKTYCWGTGSYGEIGNGANADQLTPTLVSGNHKFTHVEGGINYFCGLDDANGIYCWGRGDWGNLGNGANASSNVPVQVSGGHSWGSVSAGRYHVCALNTAGNPYCWGNGDSYEIGKIPAADSNVPHLVPDGHSFVDLASALYTNCAIKSDNTAWCWGRGTHGQAGWGGAGWKLVPTQIAGVAFTDVFAAGYAMHAVGTDGQLYSWGFGDAVGDGLTTHVLAPKAIPLPPPATDHHSCFDILQANPSTPTGHYFVDPDGAGPLTSINVYCDMTTDGGGWTLISNAGTIYPGRSMDDSNVVVKDGISSAVNLEEPEAQVFTTPVLQAFADQGDYLVMAQEIDRHKDNIVANDDPGFVFTPQDSGATIDSPDMDDYWFPGGLVMAYRMPSGIALTLGQNNQDVSGSYYSVSWLTPNSTYFTVDNNANSSTSADSGSAGYRDNWFGVSVHGNAFNGLASKDRCLMWADFTARPEDLGGPNNADAQVNNGDYKMDHASVHGGTTRCSTTSTKRGLKHWVRRLAPSDCGTNGTCYASCKEIKDSIPTAATGQYWIDADGNGTGNGPFQVFCEMDTDNGGWTLVMSKLGDFHPDPHTTYITGQSTSHTGLAYNKRYSDDWRRVDVTSSNFAQAPDFLRHGTMPSRDNHMVLTGIPGGAAGQPVNDIMVRNYAIHQKFHSGVYVKFSSGNAWNSFYTTQMGNGSLCGTAADYNILGYNGASEWANCSRRGHTSSGRRIGSYIGLRVSAGTFGYAAGWGVADAATGATAGPDDPGGQSITQDCAVAAASYLGDVTGYGNPHNTASNFYPVDYSSCQKDPNGYDVISGSYYKEGYGVLNGWHRVFVR